VSEGVVGQASADVSVVFEWDVFLAHASVDKPRVEKLYEALVSHGLRVVLDSKVLRPGDRWPRVFPGLMNGSKAFVAVFSSGSGKGLYFESEVVRAIDFEAKAGRRVIPVLLDSGAQVQYGADSLHYVTAFDDASLVQAAAAIAGVVKESTPSAVIPEGLGLINAPPRRVPIEAGSQRRLVGRDRALERVHRELVDGDGDVAVFALSGMGGIGKTALATEYCYRHVDEYPFIWWVDASSAASVTASYQALAGYLGITISDDADVREVMDMHLRARDGWLAVFDNIENRDVWHQLRPQARTGRYMVTTRSPHNWDSSVPIDTIDTADAIDWLLAAAGRPEDPDEKAAAAGIASRLGGLALALSMATAFIRQSGASISRYAQLLDDAAKDVLDHRGSLENYELTVYETWLPSVRRLRENNETTAIAFLNVISFYAPRRIPVWMFESDAFDATPFELETAIASLVALSLIERQDTFVNVHALVQEVTRHQLQTTQQPT